MRPSAAREALTRPMEDVRRLHERDLAKGFGRAGITTRVSPHVMRHSVATELLEMTRHRWRVSTHNRRWARVFAIFFAG